MTLAALIQLLAACIGIVGSLFFAIGIIRQNAAAMARLSYTYWDANPHLPGVLAAQKADYVFGGGLIVTAFALQLASFFSTDPAFVLAADFASIAPWVALGTTIASFLVLRAASSRLANYYQAQVEAIMHKQQEENERKRRDERDAVTGDFKSMQMRLGGWWRLWIALSVLYALAVTLGTYLAWPLSAKIAHHPAFDYQFSPAARSILARENKPGADGWEAPPIVVEMSNGYKFRVASDTSKESAELVAREYQDILEAEAKNQRTEILWKAFLAWLLPVVSLLGCGVTIRWVRAGFRRSGSDC